MIVKRPRLGASTNHGVIQVGKRATFGELPDPLHKANTDSPELNEIRTQTRTQELE